MLLKGIARALVVGCLLAPVGGIGQGNIAPYSADVATLDSNDQTQPVANLLVYVKPVGHSTTGNQGEFTFPSPGPGVSDVTFQIDGWVIAVPCILGSGHIHLPAKRNAIDIVAYQKGDQHLADQSKLKKLVECLIETAAVDFSSGYSSAGRISGQEHQQNAGGELAGGLLRTVSYSPTFSAAGQDSPQQSSIDHSQFIRDKAEEFGVPRDQLASAMNAWIADAENGTSAFDQGLADDYLGRFPEALDSFSNDQGDPNGNANGNDHTYKKDVLTARAQYGMGKQDAAEMTLKKVLDAHPGDTVATAALNVVQRPAAPGGVKGTVQPQ